MLEALKSGDLERAVVSRNNELDAVVLPIEEYERIMEAAELVEHLQIARLIQPRADEPADVTLGDLLHQSGIGRDEL